MFSFLVWDEHNGWIPAAHLVVEGENGEIIAEELKQIKHSYHGMFPEPQSRSSNLNHLSRTPIVSLEPQSRPSNPNRVHQTF